MFNGQSEGEETGKELQRREPRKESQKPSNMTDHKMLFNFVQVDW